MSEHYKTHCSSCNGRIEFPAGAAGSTIRCPHCGASTLLAAPGAAPAKAAEDTTKCSCKHCNGNIAFPASAAGATINCPHCGKPTELKQGSGAVQSGIEAVLDEISQTEARKPKKQPRTGVAGAGGGRSKGMLAAVAVLVLAALGGGAFFLMKKGGDKTDAGPKKPEHDLELLKHELQRAKDGGLIYVVGQVTNNTTEQFFNLKIEFELYDKAGLKLGTVTDLIGNMAPHGTWDFKALVYEGAVDQAKLLKLEGEPETAPPPAPPPAPAGASGEEEKKEMGKAE